MKIAVEGCCHGELDKIYETVTQLEAQNGFKIDVLIICGDFQSVRNVDDLQAMAVPPKFQKLNTFYKYYSGEKVAPVLTIFVGGNHEASNYLQELPYGGWVAPNIYYVGYAGIVQIGGVRIGGISGIYKGHDFNKGHFEYPPYDERSKRSVYHVRNLEVFRLKQVARNVDIFVSHDWPTGIYNYGDAAALIRTKPFFKQEVEEGSLGSKPCADLLMHLKPSYWFAAHLHVKFAALVQHATDTEENKSTKFLALDKCLPRRKFLQVLDVPHNAEEGLKIKLDPEWLRILQSTNHLLNTSERNRFMPGPGGNTRCDYSVSDSDMDKVRDVFGGDMTLPENFVETAPAFTGNPHNIGRRRPNPLSVRVNPQTTLLCTMLEITDPNASLLGKTSEQLLEESTIGLPPVDDNDDDGGGSDDDVGDGGDDSDTTMNESSCKNTTFNPSFIDSTLELSQCSSSLSSNISASWDNLIPGAGGDKKVATPSCHQTDAAKSIVNVADDDEEFLSILSAQKSKSMPSTPLLASNSNDGSSGKDKNNDDDAAPSSSTSGLLSSTPLQRSATVPLCSSSFLSSPVVGMPDSGNNNSNNASKPKKLSVADRLRALNAKEQDYKNNSVERADSTTSTDSNNTSSSLTARLTSSDSCGEDSSQNVNVIHDRLAAVSRSDTLDCRGVETRAELEAACSGGGGSSVSSTTTRSSPPVKRDNSDLLQSSNSGGGSQDDGGSNVISSSSSLSSSTSTGGGGGGSVKKFKRRNVSLYQEESQE